MASFEILFYSEPMAYNEALSLQKSLSEDGRFGWLVFFCHPTVTLGRRTTSYDLLFSTDKIKSLGVKVLEVDRGGLATYHGPGQILGFPFGTVKQHAGDSRAVREFVCLLQTKLIEILEKIHGEKFVGAGSSDSSGAGGWRVSGPKKSKEKIVSIGLKFERLKKQDVYIKHGFCLNLYRETLHGSKLTGFDIINPCGDRVLNRPGFLFNLN